MSLLSSTSRRSASLAPALPVQCKAFDANRLVLRRKQLTLLAAAPGVGKSIFARNLVVTTKAPSLYLSADSDEYTVKVGVIGALTGERLEDIEPKLTNESWDDYYSKTLQSADHVEWSYTPNIDIDYVALRLSAYAEVYGEYPHLVVIDNLGDMVAGDGDEYGELREICRELRRMARQTEAHILGLHHAKGAFENGDKPITLGALLGNIGKTVENVLGLYWPEPNNVSMTVPKARGTRRGVEIPLHVDYSTARVGEFFT